MHIDNKILVAFSTALAGLITSIITSYRTYIQSKKLESIKTVQLKELEEIKNRQSKELEEIKNRQSKELEKLKSDLELKRDIDNVRFKFLLNYETEKVSQYFLFLKQFLSTSQLIKDEVRNLSKNHLSFFDDEFGKKIELLRSKITDQYSSSVYYFNAADKGRNAHTIKKIFFDIFDLLNNKPTNFQNEINSYIDEITQKQILLQREIDSEIEQIFERLNSTV